MKTVPRTDDNILKIVSSFMGASENLILLENAILKEGKLTLPQYANYLSQIALSIELGMKSILINESDIIKTHDLQELYNKMPVAFRNMFEKTVYPKKTVDKSLEKIKVIFEEFRYMDIRNLGFFLDKSVFDTNYHIIFNQVMRLQNFQFILFLLDKIKDFYRFLDKNIDKTIFQEFDNRSFTFRIDASSLDKAIQKYHSELKSVQSNSYLEKVGRKLNDIS
jgi:hypothetical protein